MISSLSYESRTVKQEMSDSLILPHVLLGLATGLLIDRTAR